MDPPNHLADNTSKSERVGEDWVPQERGVVYKLKLSYNFSELRGLRMGIQFTG